MAILHQVMRLSIELCDGRVAPGSSGRLSAERRDLRLMVVFKGSYLGLLGLAGGGAAWALHLEFHEATDLELDGSLLGDMNRFKGFGILRSSRSAGLGLEDSEVAEFKTIAFAQLGYDLVEELLNDLLHDHSLAAGSLSDAINELFFSDSPHLIPRVSARTERRRRE